MQINSPPSFQHERAVCERKSDFPEPKSRGTRYQIRCRIHDYNLQQITHKIIKKKCMIYFYSLVVYLWANKVYFWLPVKKSTETSVKRKIENFGFDIFISLFFEPFNFGTNQANATTIPHWSPLFTRVINKRDLFIKSQRAT